ncbi:hypothetical protein [Blautia massiliensis (ex Durand et al. 2017)]|mgnify:FL=1|uniref:hypothetical protein n=1 Tax=Blautia massiliensis (ex Durand et al. 2017) TaxID=1737424 RepID=UPI0022E2AF6C|nr:hypothetical protein [Blautia massiliensis (ex Durand et al. 2017)]
MRLIGFIIWIAVYTILIITNWKSHNEHGPAFWMTNLVLSVLVQLAIIVIAIAVFGVIELTNTLIGGVFM